MALMMGSLYAAVIAVAAAMAILDAAFGDETQACIERTTKLYHRACEPADVTARAVAERCAPAPLPPSDAASEREQLDRYVADLIHRRSQRQALVAILEYRASGAPGCS